MKKKRPEETQFNSDTSKVARLAMVAPPRLQHRLKEVVVHGGRRPCIGGRCIKHAVCPYGTRDELPGHCLALELHLRGTHKALRKTGEGPTHAALMGIYLSLEELRALAAWYLSEVDPFSTDSDGRAKVQAVVEQYRGIMREQAAILRQMGAQRLERPDPSRIFADALHAAIDATPAATEPAQ
jgi:hypothetical protein